MNAAIDIIKNYQPLEGSINGIVAAEIIRSVLAHNKVVGIEWIMYRIAIELKNDSYAKYIVLLTAAKFISNPEYLKHIYLELMGFQFLEKRILSS